MTNQINKIAEKLVDLNKRNAEADTVEYLDEGAFAPEYASLVAAINQSIELDSVRRNQERNHLEMVMETQQDIEDTMEEARTGFWIIEMEDDCPPRMYADKTMRMLIAAEKNISPEDCYQRWFQRIEPEAVELVLESVQEILRTGRAEVIYPWNHPALGRIYVRCGGVPDQRFHKKGFRLKGYHQDITETMVTRKAQEKALMEALVEAKRANSAKTEFLSHMSHDIRTPINGILGMLSISEKNPKDMERQRDCRQKIRTAAEHLLSLINDVLDISKMESGAFAFTEEVFSVSEVLEGCMQIMRSQAEEMDVAMECALGNLTHSRLLGSPLHLRQILINIMGNAVKYNRPGGRIYVYMEETSFDENTAFFRFEVKDTGIGMRKEFLKHLFEPFTQEVNDARTIYRGSGLGMAITKNLVEQLGGTISVESQWNVGSVFTVNLPIKIAKKTEDQQKKPKKKDVLEQISGMRVLLVEDNELNREIAEYMLRDAGVTVVNAGDGQSAVELFNASRVGEYDCILMDVMMPVMDGLEAARRIRALDRADAQTVPVFAMTANAFAEDVQTVKEAGMNEHLAKPLNLDRMFEIMARYRGKK